MNREPFFLTSVPFYSKIRDWGSVFLIIGSIQNGIRNRSDENVVANFHGGDLLREQNENTIITHCHVHVSSTRIGKGNYVEEVMLSTLQVPPPR